MGTHPPTLEDFGDEALPLGKLLHRNRHAHPTLIRPAIMVPLDEPARFRLLQAHCAKRGKRHEFIIESAEGLKCLWCGIVRATPQVEVRA